MESAPALFGGLEQNDAVDLVDFNTLNPSVELFTLSQGINSQDGWLMFKNIMAKGGPHQICIRYTSRSAMESFRIQVNRGKIYTTSATKLGQSSKGSEGEENRFGFRESIILDLGSADKQVSIAFQREHKGEIKSIASFFLEVASKNRGNYDGAISFGSATTKPSTFRRQSSLIWLNDGSASEDPSSGWIIFENVAVKGNVTKQKLWMRYTSRDPSPMYISINGEIISNVQVASKVTDGWADANLKWFCEDHTFDLTEFLIGYQDEVKTIQVAFKACGDCYPYLSSFFFQEEENIIKSGSLDDDEILIDSANPHVFHFDIGNVGNKDERYAVVESFALTGKPITFRSGWCNDAMTIGSKFFGARAGNAGNAFPAVTFVEENDRISKLHVGMSFFAGDHVGANFCAAMASMSFQNIETGAVRDVDGVGAYLRTEDTSTWLYDREKLGLDLWLTSTSYMKHGKSTGIFQYGFALSTSEDLTFSLEAFEEFWQWLVKIKYYEVNYQVVGTYDTYSLSRLHHTPYDFKTELSDIENRMKALHDFLVSTFSGTNQLTPDTGFLYGTNTHVALTHDQFHIFVKLIPDLNYDDKAVTTLFVGGVQYDSEGENFGSLSDNQVELQSYCLMSILQDSEILFEMDLIRSQYSVLSEEREILSLRTNGAFSSYERTRGAKRAFDFLSLCGLRKVAIEEVFTKDEPWDVYSVAACHGGLFNVPTMTALACVIIQTVSPILLGIRAFASEEEDDLLFVVYLVRVFFALYAVFYELKLHSDSSKEARLASFLSMIPEFKKTWLLAGLFVNLLAKVALSFGITALLWFSYSVIDVTLNALALYFILELDNYLVPDVSLDKFRAEQEERLFQMQFVNSRYFFNCETQSVTFKNWHFYAELVQWIQRTSFIAISCGAAFIVIAPVFYWW